MIFNETFAPVSDEQVMSDDAMAQARKNMEEGQALNPLMRPDAGFFEGMGNAWKGLPSGALKTVSSLVTAASEVVGENLATTPEAKAWLNAQSQNMKEAAKSLRQYNRETFGADPDTIGTAGQVLYGLAETLPKAMAFGSGLGVAGGALAFGADMGINTTQELKDRGVDENTATWAGVESFAANSIGMRLPAALGATRLRSVGFGAVSNVGLNVAEQQGIKWTLENQNYDEIAKQYEVHMSDLIVAGAMGGAFGGAFWRKTPTAQEVQLAQMKMRPDAYIRARDGLINEYRDALLSLRKEDGTQMFTEQEALDQATLGATAEVSFAMQNGWTIEQLHANRARIDIDNAMLRDGELSSPYRTESQGAEGMNARIHSDSEPLNTDGVIADIPKGLGLPEGRLILTQGIARRMHRGFGFVHKLSHLRLDMKQRDYRGIPDVDPNRTTNSNDAVDEINTGVRGRDVTIYEQDNGRYVFVPKGEETKTAYIFDYVNADYVYHSEVPFVERNLAENGGKWKPIGDATLIPYPASGDGMPLGKRGQSNPETPLRSSGKTSHFTDKDIIINSKGMPEISIGANSSDIAKLGESQRAERENAAEAEKTAENKSEEAKNDNSVEKKETPSEVKEKVVEYLQTAWHGSPFKFDRFTLDHIGEGEGAQAHGWGLYFALERRVSERYREKLTEHPDIMVGGETYKHGSRGFTDKDGNDVSRGQSMALFALERQRDIKLARAELKKTRKENARYLASGAVTPEMLATIDEAISFLNRKTARFAEAVKGRLYGVEIPEDGVMLREDAKLSDQPAAVKESINKLREEALSEIERLREEFRVAKESARPLGECISDIEKAVGEGSEDAKTLKAYFEALPTATMARFAAKAAGTTPKKIVEIKNKVPKELWTEAMLAAGKNPLGDATSSLGSAESFYKAISDDSITGSQFYHEVGRNGGDKTASLLLNRLGVKGIRYDGAVDGECAVIFDDKAIEIKEFFQRNPNAVGFARKVMGAYNPETNRIRLTSNANISTFAHENSHWYMTNLFKFAHGDNVPETIRADVKTLLDAWGIKSLEEWDALGLEGQRKYQEQFASWTETYLAEGKAPSESLKGVFERLGKWIVDTYRSALGKDVEAAVGERYQEEFGEQLPPISDEVRKVLDRMYTDQIEASRKQIRATEEQVAAARLIQSQRLAQDKRDALLADRNNMESVEASTRAEQLAEEQIIEGRPVDISELADDIGFDNEKIARAEQELRDRYNEDPATQREERTTDGVPRPDETEVEIAETASGISEVVNAVNEVSRSAGLGDAINADAVNAAVENTARQIRETVISPRRQARMDRAMQAVDPENGEIVHAENIAQGAKDMVFTFERDDGTSVQMTAEQALAEADAEIAKAKRESAGIAEAAVCAINNGGLQ